MVHDMRTVQGAYKRYKRLQHRKRHSAPYVLVRYGALVAGTRPHTREFSQEARERLGVAVTRAREALGHPRRPSFVKLLTISIRSLVKLEDGDPVGAAVYEAVARELPGWTEDTPREILDGGPVPSARAATASAARTPHEWSAAERAQMAAMTMDAVMATYSDLRRRSEYFALSWLNEAVRIQAEQAEQGTRANS